MLGLKRIIASFKMLAVAVCMMLSLTAVNVTTSTPAQAFLCMNGNNCIMGAGLSTGITTNNLQFNTSAAAQISLALGAYLVLIAGAWVGAMEYATNTATKEVRGTIDTFFFYNQRPALQAMTEQVNIADAAQALEIIKFNDAKQANIVALDLQEQEMDSKERNKATEDGCIAATVTGGMTRSDVIKTAYAATAPIMAVSGASSLNPNGSPALGRGANAVGSGAAAGGMGADVKARFQNYKEKYCDPNTNGGKSGCTAAGPYANRDLDVAGEIFLKKTINLKDQAGVESVVNDLVTNITEPFVPDPLRGDVVNTSTGMNKMKERETYRARRQVGRDAMYHIIADRAPANTSAASAFVNEISEAAGVSAPSLPQNTSVNETMDVLSARQFQTGQYGIGLQEDTVATAKQLAFIEGIGAMNTSQTLDSADRMMLLMAAQASSNINKSKQFSSKSSFMQVKQ